MNRSLTDVPLIRPAFFDGQVLTAADMNGCLQSQQALRWLHNRGLHNWGIALGYELSGLAGDRIVGIAPGYALDCQGRELIMAEPMELAIPPVPGPSSFALTVTYAADEDLAPVMRAGACGSMGAVRRPEEPILRWRDLSDSEASPQPGLDIVLGSILVSNCRLSQPVSEAGRRSAKAETQPYVAAGTTPSGSTEWKFWPEEQPVGVSTTVDTSAAEFHSIPNYQVQVLCERLVVELSNYNPALDMGYGTSSFAGYPSIVKPTATGFDLRVVMPMGFLMLPFQSDIRDMPLNLPFSTANKDRFLEMIKKDLGWHVSWLGIEG